MDDIERKERLSRIELNQASIGRMLAESNKVNEEAIKLRAEAGKLLAEGEKFKRERVTSILLAGAAIATASAAIGGFLTKYLGG